MRYLRSNSRMNRRSEHNPHKRRGQAFVEAILGLLILAFTMAGMATLSIYLYLQNTVVTAAREGARIASLNENLGAAGTVATGTSQVRTYVKQFMTSATGQQLADGDITVVPPAANGVQGQRTVQVTVNMTVDSPFNMTALAEQFGSQENYDELETFNLVATTTMHYEE